MVNAYRPVRHPEPPSLRRPLETGDRLSPLIVCLSQFTGPEALAGQDVVRLALGCVVARALRLPDSSLRALGGLIVIAEEVSGVGEPEVIAAEKPRVTDLGDVGPVEAEKVEDVPEPAEEV